MAGSGHGFIWGVNHIIHCRPYNTLKFGVYVLECHVCACIVSASGAVVVNCWCF